MASGSKIILGALPFVVGALLFVLSLSQIPEIHRDAQYYLQSACLWNSGKVSFAGSWIGSRAFTVWIYHLAFSAFGYNIDAISLAISIAKLLTAAALAVVVWETIWETVLRCAVTVAAAVLVFTMPLMNTPATDNIAVLFLSVLWALWLAGRRNLTLAIVAFPFVAGVSLSVRSELVMLPALLVVGDILSGKLPFRWRRLAAAIASYTLGILATGLVWSTWVSVEKPPQYSGALAMFRPLAEHGLATNGPSSARLFEVARQNPSAPLDYWKALGTTYIELGPEKSNALLTAAGAEAMMKNALPILKSTLSDTWTLLDSPGAYLLKNTDPKEEMDTLTQQLSDLDAIREQTSANFGGDFTYRTKKLTEGRIAWIERLRGSILGVPIRIELFGGVLVISLLMCGGAGIAFRDPSWLCIPLYGLAVCLLAALTQGVVYRYIAPALLLNFIAAAASAAALLSRVEPPATRSV
ncbi:hypothetical protein [Rhizobium sp. BR 315]|uniref:hypothetical protein n=1 Tax=Rhizobium sp. BR 315 TaxID=3040014 RepID=UPI003D34931D